jgi:phospholipid transport system transporter-binding protein
MLEWLEIKPEHVAIRGELDQWQVARLMPIATLLSKHQQHLTIDLSGIDKVDSAGVAFLLELKEHAMKLELNINFCGSPSSLNKLKSLYNLEQLF